MPTEEGILRKIKSLLEMAERGTEHEAAIAANKAQRLMSQYSIERSALRRAEQRFATASDVSNEIIAEYPKRIAWHGMIAQAIASTNCCEMYYNWTTIGRKKINDKIRIIGQPHHIALVKSLFNYLIATVERLASEGVKKENQRYLDYLRQIEGTGMIPIAKPDMRRWRSNFILGCASRIVQRLHEAHQEQQEGGFHAEDGNTITALAVQDLETEAKTLLHAYKVEQGLADMKLVRRSSASVTLNDGGFTSGHRAGDRVNLNKQVSGTAQRSLSGG